MRKIIRLGVSDHPIPQHFTCKDADLDDFFCNQWQEYYQELMAATYAVFEDEQLIAMFSVVNDRVESEDFGSKSRARRLLKRLFPFPSPKKGYKHFPSVKLARLGVNHPWHGKAVGSWVIELLKAYFVLNNKTGCRFLTVDSYPTQVDFYKKNGFEIFDEDGLRKEDEYVYMKYDLKITKDQFQRDPTKQQFMTELINDVDPNGLTKAIA